MQRLLVSLLVLSAFAHAGRLANSAAAERPNFIFFITDDISPDDLAAEEHVVRGNRPVVGSPTIGSTITMVERPSVDGRNRHYVSNREPLQPSPFAKLPIGAIEPHGWLKKQLELQADGMCGHLADISKFCREDGNAWLTEDPQAHGFWEEVPYWLKGFGDLGYVLDDRRIQGATQRWIEAVLDSQQDDGWFGPRINRASPRNKTSIEGERVQGRPDMWPNALMMSVLRSHYQATGDERIIQHLLRYCQWLRNLPEEDYLIHWVAKRRGIEVLKNVLWLYNTTGEPWLLELARKTHRRTNDWTSGISRYHCVDISECFCEPALYYTLANDRRLLDAAERNHRLVFHEYGQVPGGMFGADEMSRPGYTGPRQATETCGMVEMMHTCQMMFCDVEGDVRWADRCEDVALNSYPAATTADMRALRYLTAPNLVVSDRTSKNPDICNGGPMYLMTPHGHRCCQHNHAHGWPYYAEHLWLATPDNGLCAMLYAASRVTAKVADGDQIRLTADTHYPFADRVTIQIATEQAVRFPLYLRIPGWCAAPLVEINGAKTAVPAGNGYLRIERTWQNDDRVELRLPMVTRLRNWAKNGGCVSIDRGPLTYSLQIGERYKRVDVTPASGSRLSDRPQPEQAQWPAWEIFPTTPWNYGLVVNEDLSVKDLETVQGPWPENDMPWTHEGAPIRLTATARRIPNWQLQSNNLLGPMQRSPIRSDEPNETVTLLPMGACRLRLSAFPVIGDGAKARDWSNVTQDQRHVLDGHGTRIVASHVHAKERLNADDSIVRSGDWIVSDEEVVCDQHIRLDGSLILPQGTKLTLENCTLEIAGDYSRHHNVDWRGGTLVTEKCTIGGFVNENGTAIHTVFHLYDGLWEATDTVVQYSYGISFHWREGKGILRGTRLKAGPRPDAIILSGEADVTLVDSQFPIGLGVYVDKGGSTTLDLTPGQSVTATFDRGSLLPGVNWRLSMTNTRVQRWFLFVRQIGGWHPPAEITLARSKGLIVSLLGHNLTGDVTLTSDLSEPLHVGNVTLKTADKPAGISMYALYLSGKENDLTVTGRSHICELMLHSGGKMKIAGTTAKNEISIGCTTLDLGGEARLELENVHLGRPLAWQGENEIGEATIKGNARLIGSHLSVRNVRFRTEDTGQVALENVQRHGKIETREDGGSISISDSNSQEPN